MTPFFYVLVAGAGLEPAILAYEANGCHSTIPHYKRGAWMCQVPDILLGIKE